MSGAAIEAQKVSIIRFKKHAGAPNAHSAIVVLRSVVDEAFCYWARIVPNSSASPRVERVGIVRGGHKHHAPDDYRRYLKIAHVAHMKDPLRFQLADIGRCNFRQTAEASSGIISVIGKPIFTGGRGQMVGLDI